MQRAVSFKIGADKSSSVNIQRTPDTCSTHAAPQLRAAPRISNASSSSANSRSWRVHSAEITRSNFSSYGNRPDSLPNLRQELQQQLQSLSRTAAILPGSINEKARIDELLTKMEAANPCPYPIGVPSGRLSGSSQQGTLPSGIDPLLFGVWDLVYTSNGTAVTRTGLAQALILASEKVPGVGVSEITQTLVRTSERGVDTSNTAVFGLGPGGSWNVCISGSWTDSGDGKTVKVKFDNLKVKMAGFAGLPLPEWLPQVTLGPFAGTAGSRGAEWNTSYLDQEIRIGKGSTGNKFLFFRRPEPAN